MAKQTINNGDSGLTARGKINSNFTELYARGYSRCDTFEASVGTVTVDITLTSSGATPDSDYEVLFFSPDGVGCSRATSKATTSFQVTCNAEGTVIYLLHELN